MKNTIQYLILIALVIGTSLMIINYIFPMVASVIFCISLAGLLIKVVNAVINFKTNKKQ